MTDMVLNVAAKAVIVNDEGKVLILRESGTYAEGTMKGKWGVPGGRLEPSEAFFDGLQREVFEETGLTVDAVAPIHVGEWRPVIGGVTHQIISVYMCCALKSGDVIMSEDHDVYAWVDRAALRDYAIMPQDDEAISRGLDRGVRA